jgi:membrane-associated phospholipid phosphatase
VHLRAHHASDVVAGAVIGAVTGLAVRKVVDALT